MFGENRDVGQDTHAEPGRHRGLNAGQVRARVRDVPGAARGFERMNGAIAIEAALLEHGERH